MSCTVRDNLLYKPITNWYCDTHQCMHKELSVSEGLQSIGVSLLCECVCERELWLVLASRSLIVK